MLNRQLVVLILSLLCFTPIASFAQNADDSQLEVNAQYVERAVLTSAVENREPVDNLGHAYRHSGADYDQLVFFTHMINHDGRGIRHQWWRNGELDSEVTLAVGSDSWRTYSSRRISYMASGDWQVRVLNDRDQTLVEYEFSVSR